MVGTAAAGLAVATAGVGVALFGAGAAVVGAGAAAFALGAAVFDTAAINKSNVWEGMLEGGVYGAINGFTTGAIMGFFQGLSQVVSKSVNAVDKCTPGSGQCFIAGTLVACLTAEGNETQKPIEEVQVGDKVLAYNEETGEQAYKAVKSLFRNETKEWHHILVGDEEIVCTGGHPFFVLNADSDRNTIHFEGRAESIIGKWIAAKDLQVGDLLLQGNGSQVRVGSITIETLEEPETTYNFEVEDFHTYYVSHGVILVHNICPDALKNDASISKDIVGNGKYGSYDIEYASGKHYIGKGGQGRMWQSAARNANLNGDAVVSVKWRPSSSNLKSFIQEAQWMQSASNNGISLYNKIASPGFKYMGIPWSR